MDDFPVILIMEVLLRNESLLFPYRRLSWLRLLNIDFQIVAWVQFSTCIDALLTKEAELLFAWKLATESRFIVSLFKVPGFHFCSAEEFLIILHFTTLKIYKYYL